MKQISQPIQDVDVELISFHEENVYETLTNVLSLNVQEVPSIKEAIARMKAQHPVALVPYGKNSFLLIKKREEESIISHRQNGSRAASGWSSK